MSNRDPRFEDLINAIENAEGKRDTAQDKLDKFNEENKEILDKLDLVLIDNPEFTHPKLAQQAELLRSYHNAQSQLEKAQKRYEDKANESQTDYQRKIAHASAIRSILEKVAKNFVKRHGSCRSCRMKLSNDDSVSYILQHMGTCSHYNAFRQLFDEDIPSDIEFRGLTAYQELSQIIHNSRVVSAHSQVFVPDDLDLISKRFLIRLLKVKGYDPKICGMDGDIREPTENEIKTPTKPSRKRCRSRDRN